MADLPKDERRSAGPVRLASPEPLSLPHLDKSLRVIVRPTGEGKPELLDLVRRELFERYFKEQGKQSRWE